MDCVHLQRANLTVGYCKHHQFNGTARQAADDVVQRYGRGIVWTHRERIKVLLRDARRLYAQAISGPSRAVSDVLYLAIKYLWADWRERYIGLSPLLLRHQQMDATIGREAGGDMPAASRKAMPCGESSSAR